MASTVSRMLKTTYCTTVSLDTFPLFSRTPEPPNIAEKATQVQRAGPWPNGKIHMNQDAARKQNRKGERVLLCFNDGRFGVARELNLELTLLCGGET